MIWINAFGRSTRYGHDSAVRPGLWLMPVQNAEIAAMFDRTAELLEIQGENPFRVRAYRRAARVIEGCRRM